jgi:hypothetical protein
MKLNLLPATVSKGRAAKTAVLVSVILFVVSSGASVAMITSSAKELQSMKDQVAQARPAAERALATSRVADSIVGDSQVQWLVKNVGLTQSMIAHNDTYPDLYASLFPYVPPFFRLTSVSAQPVSNEQAVVTMTGTLKSYQQYADLMLALMRNPNAVTIARGGFQSVDPYVPNLNSVDQQGRPRRPGEQPIPDDPLERLQFFQQQGSVDTGAFTGTGNFGTGTDSTRGAMPDDSLVTVTMVVNANLMVPNARGTLASGPAGGGGGAPGMPPGMGMPPRAGMPPGGPPVDTSGGGANPRELDR